MSRATRYEEQKPRLNIKKVFGTVFVLLLLTALAFGIVFVINEGQGYKVKRNVLKHYFVSYKEDTKKYGVIDASGEKVLENKYDELIFIPDKEKDLFLVTENVNYEDGTYEVHALNKNGNAVLKGYQELKPIEYSGLDVQYDTNLLQFKRDGKIGLVKFDETEVFKPIFSEVKTMKNIPHRLLVKEGDKYGVVNTEVADYVVPALYRSIEPISQDKNTGYIVKFDTKAGIFGSNGQEILPSEYDSISKLNSTDFFKATKNKETNIYNKEGKVVIKGDVPNIVNIKENIVVQKKANKVGAIDFTKKEIIPYIYQEIIPASIDKYIVKTNNKYNLRTKAEDKLLPNEYNSLVYNQEAQIYIASNDSYADIFNIDLSKQINGVISKIDFEKGIMELYQNDELKMYNFQFEEKTERDVYPENNLNLFKNEEGKYGYMNHQDRVIVEPIYDEAKFQNKYGYMAVSIDNKWGVLNYNGAVILEPTLDFSDFLIIDFIKDWYYDKNIELNIYTKSIVLEQEETKEQQTNIEQTKEPTQTEQTKEPIVTEQTQ